MNKKFTGVKLFSHDAMDSMLINEYVKDFEEFLIKAQVMPNGHWAIEEFEKRIAKYNGFDYAVAVSSGTTALKLAMQSMKLRKGSKVITTPFTYIATASAIVSNGLIPVFADIDENTLQISDEKIVELIDDETSCILPVHINGTFCEIPKTKAMCKERNIKILEDSAQMIPNMDNLYTDLDAACISLGPTKSIVGLGEAGVILTSNKDIADNAKILRNNGNIGGFKYVHTGDNGKIDAVITLFLLRNLEYVKEWNLKRDSIAREYDKRLGVIKQAKVILRSGYSSHCKYSFYAEKRDELLEHLIKHNIEAEIYYPVPLQLQVCFEKYGYKEGDLPSVESACKNVISLPINEKISIDDVNYIMERIEEFYEQ